MTTSSQKRSIGGALALLVTTPGISNACANCFAATGTQGLRAYYLSTILLSTMPFLLIGLIMAIAYTSRRIQNKANRELGWEPGYIKRGKSSDSA